MDDIPISISDVKQPVKIRVEEKGLCRSPSQNR